uniref:Putative secreted protein n=1 Tax=Anopheles aquasalis TaxID=42839 RepID=T1DP75_ANOAQ
MCMYVYVCIFLYMCLCVRVFDVCSKSTKSAHQDQPRDDERIKRKIIRHIQVEVARRLAAHMKDPYHTFENV